MGLCVLTRLIDEVYVVDALPAVYIATFNVAIIADLHLGFEEEMASKGIYLPKAQLRKAIELLDRISDSVRVEMLVIAGDVKHIFERLGRKEAKDVIQFLSHASTRFPRITIVRGNHDTYIYGVARRFGIDVCDKLWLGDILIVHGHRELDVNDKPRLVVMGHEHPSIAIRDSIGAVAKVPCFLVTRLKRGCYAIVLPAAGLYQSGTVITTLRSAYLSPILREEAELEDAIPYALIEEEGVLELPPLKLVEQISMSL